MADRRRRRRASVNSEEFSEDETSETPSPSEKNGVKKTTENIEQEETESESGEEEESEEEDSEEDEDDDEEDVTADYDGDDDIIVDDEGWIEEERQSGDGEEQPDSTKEKDLDDDEDRKNPAYIPRRGMFYEHDDRRMDEPQEGGAPPSEVPPEKEQQESRPKKKLWKEDLKWDHDRFNSEQQAPKSREELIAAYGYDIRLYDKPPDRPRPRNRDRQPRRKKQFSDYIQEDRFRKDRYQENEDHYRNQSQYSNNSYQNDNNRTQRDNRDRGYREDRERGYRDNQERGYRGRSDRQRGGFRGRGNGWRKNPPRSYEELREGNTDRYRDNDYNEENQKQYSSRQWTNNSFRINDHSSHEDSSSPEKIRSPDRQEQTYRSSNRNNSKPAYAAPPSRNHADSVPASRQPAPHPEKKSYLRERRSKGIGKTRYQASDVQDVQDNLEQLDIKDDPPKPIKTEAKESPAVTSYVYPTTAPPITTIAMPPPGSLEKKEVQNANVKSSPPPPVTVSNVPSNKGEKKAYPVTSNNAQSSSTKPEVAQSRTKRYSSQRQRGMQDAPYQEQILEGAPPPAQPYYGQGFPGNTAVFRPEQPIPQPVSHGFSQQPRIPSPVRYTMPVAVTSHGAMHSPPRLYSSPLTTLATAQPIPAPALLQPPYLTPPGISFAPPAGAPPPHYPMGGHIPVQAFPPAPPPQPQPQIAVPSQQQPEIHIRGGTTYFPTEVQQPSRQRGGTTYFPPEVQQPSPHRSPVRRQKAAIPIVNPQDVHSEVGEKGEVLTEYYYPEEDLASMDASSTDPAYQQQQMPDAPEPHEAVSTDHHTQPAGHDECVSDNQTSETSDPQPPDDEDQSEATPVSHSNGTTEPEESDTAYTLPDSGKLEDKTDLPSSSDGIQNEQNSQVEVAQESNTQEVEIIPITDTKMVIKDSEPVHSNAEPVTEPTSQSVAATESVAEGECNVSSDSPTAPLETVQTHEMEKTEPPST